ncbi:PcfJ domain-containing protein [Psychrobacter sp. AOP31-A1-22]|uniref:PcfJ domain-containing protein n=1 Tax=Psychrobacter sp. AOP31-A1-22 TaxID=3457696 RepID=UPI004036EF5B
MEHRNLNEQYRDLMLSGNKKASNDFYEKYKTILDEHAQESRRERTKRWCRLQKTKSSLGTEYRLNLIPKVFKYEKDGLIHIFNKVSRSSDVVKVYFIDPAAWYMNRQVVQSTGDTYHLGFKGLCPVLHNSEYNPIELTLYEDSETQKAQWISDISMTKLKTGGLSLTVEVEKITLSHEDKQDRYTALREVVATYKLDISERGTPTFYLEGQESDCVGKFIEMTHHLCNQLLFTRGYSINKDYVPFNQQTEWFFKEVLHTRNSLSVFSDHTIAERLAFRHDQLKEHKNLNDLPWSRIELLKLFNSNITPTYNDEDRKKFRDRLLGLLANNDTKEAVDVCLGGRFSPSLRKTLLKEPLFSIPSGIVQSLLQAEVKIGRDNTRRFITLADERTIDWSILSRKDLIKGLALGLNVFHIKKIMFDKTLKSKERKNKVIESITLVEDTVRMRSLLKSENVEFNLPSNNVKEAHDYLVPLVNTHRQYRAEIRDEKRRKELEEINNKDTSKRFDVFEVNDIVIRPPVTPKELYTVGQKMNHCISMYASQFCQGFLDIALILDKDTEEYLVCIEIRNKAIVQAKMKYNRQARYDIELNKIINDFADQRGFLINTNDLINIA